MAQFNFSQAKLTNNNLGGLCGLNCKPAGSPIAYNRNTGLCTFTDTSASNQCVSSAEHELYYKALSQAETASGHRVDLRVTNLTEYFPYNSNSNGQNPNANWGQINIQGNHAVKFKFEFIDAVRTLACAMPPTAYRIPRCPLACEPATVQPPTALSLYRTPTCQSCWKSSA